MAATFIIHVQFQVVNYNHMMPTRYSVDISFDKANINKELMKVTSLASLRTRCHESRSRARVTSQRGSRVTWLPLGPCGSGHAGLRAGL